MEMFGLGDGINAGHRAAELYLSMQSSWRVSPLLSATRGKISVIDDVILGIITAGRMDTSGANLTDSDSTAGLTETGLSSPVKSGIPNRMSEFSR